MKHEITLTQPAAWLLGLLLSRPSWAKTEGESYRASKIAYRILPDLDVPKAAIEAPDQRAGNKADPVWSKASVTFILTDGQREVVRTCLKHSHSLGAVVNGPWTMELDEVFGLAPEDELPENPSAPSAQGEVPSRQN